VAASAYTDYDMEGLLAGNGIRLWAARKNNSNQATAPAIDRLLSFPVIFELCAGWGCIFASLQDCL
jgi:hypothetical protein